MLSVGKMLPEEGEVFEVTPERAVLILLTHRHDESLSSAGLIVTHPNLDFAEYIKFSNASGWAERLLGRDDLEERVTTLDSEEWFHHMVRLTEAETDVMLQLRINAAASIKEWLESLNPVNTGLPHYWELLGYLVPRAQRPRVFAPAYNDLLADYFETRQARFRTRWSSYWLAFCFTLQTVFLVARCLRCLCADWFIHLLVELLPTTLREWWRRQP